MCYLVNLVDLREYTPWINRGIIITLLNESMNSKVAIASVPSVNVLYRSGLAIWQGET